MTQHGRRPHQPKTRALLALCAGALSPAGRARLLRHLDACEICRRQLAAVRAYDQVAREAASMPVPTPDFARMERALAAEAHQIVRRQRVRRKRRRALVSGALASGVALLTAALAYLALLPPPASEEQARLAPPAARPSEQTVAAAAPLEARVTLAAGSAQAIRDGQPTALAPGDRVASGDQVLVGEQSRVDIRFWAGSGCSLSADTRVAFDQRPHALALRLARGEVAVDLTPFERSMRVIILAGGATISTEGGRFIVAYRPAETPRASVELISGQLRVEHGGRVEQLIAPARWNDRPHLEQPDAPAQPSRVARSVVGLQLDATSSVHLDRPGVVRWRVGRTDIAARAPLSMVAQPGPVRVEAWDRRGRHFRADIEVGPTPLQLPAAGLVETAPRERPGHLARAEVLRAVQRGRPSLQRCYESALRRNPNLEPRIRLRLRIDRLGRVDRVSFRGQPKVSSMKNCVRQRVRTWIFPPPGGPLTIELPVRFTRASRRMHGSTKQDSTIQGDTRTQGSTTIQGSTTRQGSRM